MRFVNTFSGGLDKDTTPTSYKPNNYYDARNFSIVVAEDLSSATLTNTKGVTTTITYDTGTTRKIVGLVETPTTLVIFIKGVGESGEIHEVLLDTIDSTVTPIDLSSGTYLVVTKNFNFGDNIKVVAREETPTLRKIYWVDDNNPLRYCNLALGNTVLSGYSLNQFEINQNATLTNPQYVGLIGGSLRAGVYQYAYCLYNQNANQTTYSPFSQFIQVTETGLTTTSVSFKGSAVGTETTTGIQISITDTNSEFAYMRVISLFYTTPDANPEVTIIYEGTRTSTVNVSHTGTQILGTLTLEEAIATVTVLTPKTIASKNNYLFIGNITEESFDVDFDARTYRFNSSGTARMYNNTSDPLNSSYYREFTSANYPSTEDEYNASPRNILDWDNGPSGTYAGYKFQSNGTTIGGEGPNVLYNFITKVISYNNTTSWASDMKIWSTDENNSVTEPDGLGGYANPANNAYVGYQRDEIYRVGIIFYNIRGQISFVKWIGDIRMPYYSDNSNQFSILSDNYTEDFRFHILGLEFNFDFSSLPEEVVAYQVVRTERTYDDATVVDTGYIGHLQKDSSLLYWGGYARGASSKDLYPSLHSTVDTEHSLKDIVEYISAETNYNKNNDGNYNRFDIYDGGISGKPKRDVSDSYDVDNAVLTRLKPYSTYNTTNNIEDTVLFRAQRSTTAQQNLPASFGGYSLKTRSHIKASGSRGYKGTTLVLKLEDDITGLTDHTSPYVLRRRTTYPYGGFTLSAISSSTYYPCSPITPITTTTLEVWGGDTYISVFEYMRTLWADGKGSSWGDDRYCQIVQCLVESKLNLNYTINNRWSTYDDGNYRVLTTILSDLLTYMAMWETSGTWEFYVNDSTPRYFVQDFNLYTYNPVYSLTTGKKSYIPKPTNFTDTTQYSTRVYTSEKKINGEVSDSWLQFLPNNLIDVDNQFGVLSTLYNYNNTLMFFQDSAFGVLPVEDRELVSTSTGASVSIGTGGVLQRYDYINTSTGTSESTSIANSLNSLYFVDTKLKKICRFSGGQGTSFISDTKGLYAYIKNKDITSIVTYFDPVKNEMLFSFPTETISYNEYSDSFIGLSDTIFDFAYNYNSKNIVFKNTQDGSSYYVTGSSLYTGEYGKYAVDYNSSTYYSSTLDLIINPARELPLRYDILQLSTDLSDSGTPIEDETFNSIRVRNNYQDTGTITLTPDNNIVRRFRTWRFNQLRDGSDEGRLIDNYARLTLSFTNDGTKRLKLNDIVSTVTPLNINRNM